MSDISCIGLGRMGSALVRALLAAGVSVTVWNRSPEKMNALNAAGATPSASLRAAIADSPALLFCVDSYRTVADIASDPVNMPELRGRSVVNLTTGTSREARETAAMFNKLGAYYLDGAILGGPPAIGTPRVTLLYAGAEEAFMRMRPLLLALGSNTRFVGDDPGAAAALDFAWLLNRYAVYLSAACGTLICEAEGLNLDQLAEIHAPGDPARWLIDVVRANAFENPTATLAVWTAALEHILAQMRERNLDASFPVLVHAILQRAIEAGHGEEHIAAMVKVLRRA